MKKLATLVVALASFAIATPVFACPNMDHAEGADKAPRTAEKDKKETPSKSTDQAKAKEQPKAPAPAKEQPAKDTTAKPAETKKADKVSSR